MSVYLISCTPLYNGFAKHCRDVWSGQVIFHPWFDTLSPSCKSRTSLGTKGSGATELLGLLKRGSPFIWGCYNSTKACGCLHTMLVEDEWAALTLHTCTNKSCGSAKGKACQVWSPWTSWNEKRHEITQQPLNTLNWCVQLMSLCFLWSFNTFPISL